MMDGSDRVEFAGVEVVSADHLVVMCRIGKRVVAVSPRRMLPGTDISRQGDRGRLVLSRDVAVRLGLA